MGGDAQWNNGTRWTSAQPGYPNSTSAVAMVDVDFTVETINVTSNVSVSKLVVGSGCSRLQIVQSSAGVVRLTAQTNPLDTATIMISGTVLKQPISISVTDPFVTGRVVFVNVRTELGTEEKMFQLSRSSTTSGAFFGSFETEQGPACPNMATTLCVTGPQDIIASYMAPLTGQIHNASFDIACADFAEFSVSEVEWMLIVDIAKHNYNKLLDLKNNLASIQSALDSRSYAANINHYKAVAQQSFLLGSTCFENYCASTNELAHKLSLDGGQVPDFQTKPFSRLNPEDQH